MAPSGSKGTVTANAMTVVMVNITVTVAVDTFKYGGRGYQNQKWNPKIIRIKMLVVVSTTRTSLYQ